MKILLDECLALDSGGTFRVTIFTLETAACKTFGDNVFEILSFVSVVTANALKLVNERIEPDESLLRRSWAAARRRA